MHAFYCQFLLSYTTQASFLSIPETPPSFCDMGNAISSLISQDGTGQAGLDEEGEENVLLSEEHSLVLTCCWVTLKVGRGLEMESILLST